MHRHEQPPGYQAYLLRMWQERTAADGHGPVWRFQLEEPHTGRRQGFRDLDALLAELREVVAGDKGPADAQTEQQH